jgi:phage tail sheath protein FI
MATYLRPGVFIEESLQPLADPADGNGPATAAFVGTSLAGGPVGPVLISSWPQFQTLFGDIRHSPDDLHYALWQFFANGGHQAYVVRAALSDAVAGAVTVNDTQGTPAPTLTVTAKSPGAWATASSSSTRVLVTITPSTTGARFDLVVQVGPTGAVIVREQFIDLTLDPADPRYALAIVNSSTVGSLYIKLTKVGTWTGITNNPASSTATPLTGGTDGVTGTPDLLAATQKLEGIPRVLNVNVPGSISASVMTTIINWAAGRTTAFVVVDGPAPAASDTEVEVTSALTTFVASLPASSYGAVYGPWLYLADPASGVPGAMRLVAPGGAVLGQYAYTDINRGVQKAPAGIDSALRGTLGTHVRFTETQLDTLNQANVNVIRAITGAGFCIMGARTLNKGMPDRYVPIRRTLMTVAKDLKDITQFAVFEPNNSTLWERIEVVIEQYLVAQMQSGLLKGTTPDEAYYVKCDSENNPPSSQNAGVVNIEVGVAVHSPAEFVIIRIGQYTGGATTEITA